MTAEEDKAKDAEESTQNEATKDNSDKAAEESTGNEEVQNSKEDKEQPTNEGDKEKTEHVTNEGDEENADKKKPEDNVDATIEGESDGSSEAKKEVTEAQLAEFLNEDHAGSKGGGTGSKESKPIHKKGDADAGSYSSYSGDEKMVGWSKKGDSKGRGKGHTRKGDDRRERPGRYKGKGKGKRDRSRSFRPTRGRQPPPRGEYRSRSRGGPAGGRRGVRGGHAAQSFGDRDRMRRRDLDDSRERGGKGGVGVRRRRVRKLVRRVRRTSGGDLLSGSENDRRGVRGRKVPPQDRKKVQAGGGAGRFQARSHSPRRMGSAVDGRRSAKQKARDVRDASSDYDPYEDSASPIRGPAAKLTNRKRPAPALSEDEYSSYDYYSDSPGISAQKKAKDAVDKAQKALEDSVSAAEEAAAQATAKKAEASQAARAVTWKQKEADEMERDARVLEEEARTKLDEAERLHKAAEKFHQEAKKLLAEAEAKEDQSLEAAKVVEKQKKLAQENRKILAEKKEAFIRLGRR